MTNFLTYEQEMELIEKLDCDILFDIDGEFDDVMPIYGGFHIVEDLEEYANEEYLDGYSAK